MPRILVVEDDESMRGLIRDRLSDSFEVTDTGDATEALGLALASKPDCILVDLMMPRFSGLELCQTFASVSNTQTIPIFVITGQSAEEHREFVDPAHDVAQRFGTQPIQALAPVPAHGDKLGLFEDAQMLRNRGKRHPEGLRELARGPLAVLERHEDCATCRMRDGVKDVTLLDRAHGDSTRGTRLSSH